MVDEPGSDGALGFIDTVVEGLSVFDKRSELAVRFGGHVHRFEFAHGSHASELQGIVLIGLTFDIRPSPCIFVGRADEGFESETDAPPQTQDLHGFIPWLMIVSRQNATLS